MQKVDVRYLGDPQREERVAIHPADEMRAKRELAGKAWADDEYRLFYQTFLACRRSELVAGEVDFDAWLETVSEVEPIITEKQIHDALALGTINERGAELMREQLERQGSGLGESPTRPT